MEEHPPEILMIYTTKNGRTGSMVEPIERGIIDAGGTVATRRVDEVQWAEMVAAKGIIVGTPVRFGPGALASAPNVKSRLPHSLKPVRPVPAIVAISP